MSKSILSNTKIKNLKIKAYAKLQAPKCTKLKSFERKGDVEIFTELELPLDPNDIQGRTFFHATNRNDVKYSKTVIAKSKYRKKFLVWQAIDSDGNVFDAHIATGTYFKRYLFKRVNLKKR